MQSILFALLSLPIGGTTLAVQAPSPIDRRQVQTNSITQALSPVMQSLQILDTAVNSMISGSPQTAFNILSVSTSVSSSMTQAAGQIGSNDNGGNVGFGRPGRLGGARLGGIGLGGSDLNNLQASTNTLMTQIQTTMNSFVRQAPVFAQLGATQSTVQSLVQQQSASGQLGQALVAQAPTISRNQFQQSMQQLNAVYNQGIAALQQAGTVGTGTGVVAGTAPGAPIEAVPGAVPAATGVPAARAVPIVAAARLVVRE